MANLKTINVTWTETESLIKKIVVDIDNYRNFNKMQLNLLLYNTKIQEVVIAFDKEYCHSNDEKARKYFERKISYS